MGFVSLRLLPKINSLIRPFLSSPILLHSIPIQLPPDQKLPDSVSTRNYSAAVKKRSFDFNILNNIISCSCASYQVDYGFSMLGIILKLGFVPNQYTYHSLLTGLVSQNKHLDADILFHKLIRLKQIQPDFATYHSFIQGVHYLTHYNTNNQQEEKDLTSFSRSIGLLTYLKLFIGYDALIIGFCEREQFSIALEHFQEMLDIPLTPSDKTYNSILQLLFQEGDYPIAFSFLHNMQDKCVPLHSVTYAIIIHGLCKDQLFGDALHLLTQMELDNCSVGVHLYNVVIHYLFTAGEVDKALYVFDRLSELYHIRPNATTYAEMLIGLSNQELWDEALDLHPEIESGDHLPSEFKLACHNYFNESPFPPQTNQQESTYHTHTSPFPSSLLPSMKQIQL